MEAPEEEKGKEQKKMSEEIMAKNFTNLMQNFLIYTSKKLNKLQIHKHKCISHLNHYYFDNDNISLSTFIL